jgi:hypothetical protein
MVHNLTLKEIIEMIGVAHLLGQSIYIRWGLSR